MKTFVKLSEDKLSYTTFKNPVQIDGVVRFINSEKAKNDLGYYELDSSYPTVQNGYHAEWKSWTYDSENNKIVGVYDIVEDEKIPRIFSKYKIMTYMIEKEMWSEVKSWIQTSGYSDFWDVPLEFDESDPYFKKGVEAFCSKFQVSESELEEILDSCVKD